MVAREVFPYPPLQLVIFEARHGGVADVDVGRETLDGLMEAVGQGSRVGFGVSTLRIADPSAGPEAALFQIVDPFGTASVTMWPTSFVVEATDYQHFEAFREVVTTIFGVFMSNASVAPPFARIGLRYVDELHPDPPALEPLEWGKWIDSRLVGLATIARRPVTGFGGGLSVDLGDSCGLSFRFATLAGPAVESTGPLQLRPRPATPAIVLDTDGFWLPSDPESLDTPKLGALLDRLHDGVRELFDEVVTEESRALFRGEVARQ
jgi:uncharacterized protein (TIGR04255 family)